MSVLPAARSNRGALRHQVSDHDDSDHDDSDNNPGSRGGPLPAVSELGPGAAHGKFVYLDAQSGIAGDMTIAALLDLGVPFRVVSAAVQALALPGIRIEARRVQVGSLRATRFDVSPEAEAKERSHAEIQRLLRAAPLDDEVRSRAERVFARLASAEARVHGVPVERVHFHEVGAADAIVDIVGACAALTYLGGRLLCSPLPLGHGHTECRHGTIPIPAPATLLCLEGKPTYDGGLDVELTTPTGAAIVSALAHDFVRWPESRPLGTGWGAGHRSLPDRPNALRAVLADPVAPPQSSSHEVIECNVDDMTGEELAFAITRLYERGALDAWATPIVMKKGRAAWCLSALAERASASQVSDAMLRESSTIGLRRTLVSRVELPRRVRVVDTPFGQVPIKESGAADAVAHKLKPEFEACASLAERHGVPVRDVINAALRAALADES